MTPKPHQNVIATYSRNLIMVHRWDDEAPYDPDLNAVVCGREFPVRHHDWWWIRFDFLNPDKVLMCKRGCWKGSSR